MHLTALTLKGFKSFASTTRLKLEPGICAVVGPNGSGKSNVVDALAWVMGEQGAKTLRGGKMEDVIFAGAGGRKPLGRAEVTLTFDNSDGRLPVDYAEVSVTRRMFRDGASEYEINGAKARLMDVQELLSDSGIGREMHVIVGQGKLAEILESRPEERRGFIEEAAGVLKHRRRKDKARRKLAGMQANLDRLRDLTGDLEERLKPLARQAEAATKAQRIQAELRDASLKVAAARAGRARGRLEEAEAEHERLSLEAERARRSREEAADAHEAAESRLQAVGPEAERAQELFYRFSALSERVAATRRVAAERARAGEGEEPAPGQDPEELEAAAKRADAEDEELAEAVDTAAERLEAVREELAEREDAAREAEERRRAAARAAADRRAGAARLEAEEEQLAAQLESLSGEEKSAREARAEAARASSSAAAELAEAKDRLEASAAGRAPLVERDAEAAREAAAAEERLEWLRGRAGELEREVAGLEARVEALGERGSLPGAAERLTDPEPLSSLLGAPPRLAAAAAAALGGHADALVADAAEAAALDPEGLSRSVIVARDETPGEAWRLDAELPEGCTWLVDALEPDPAVRRAVSRLLADVCLAPDRAAAERAVAADPRIRAVTEDGELRGEGWVALGRGEASGVELAGEAERAAARRDEAAAQLETLAGSLEGARSAAEDARVQAASAAAALREHDHSHRELARAVEHAERGEAERAKNAERAERRIAELEDKRGTLESRLEEVRDRLDEADDAGPVEDDAGDGRAEEAAALLEQVRAVEVEARLSLRSAEERRDHSAGRGDRLRRQAEAERARRARIERAQQAARRRRERAGAVAELAEEVAGRAKRGLEEAAARRDEANDQLAEARDEERELKSRLSAAQKDAARLAERVGKAEVERDKAQGRLDELARSVLDRLGVELSDLPAGEVDEAAEKARAAEAKKSLESLGKVNPLALEEYNALEERYRYLAGQLADVERARADLEGVIEEVDALILTLFRDAWNDVQAEFPKVFETLFPGGEGRLYLTDPDDLLATGIELEARPPGKKVKRLSLLSGGEKSLTALALLVSIFRARPSPFYVMDEVEAALDDVNLRRLLALFEELREDSQLIVITHQKPTMDIANVLYGVTMRGDGVTKVISQRMKPEAA